MISVKKINKKDELVKVNKLLVKNGFQRENEINQIIYVMEENEEIIGVTKISVINNIGLLNYLIIDEDRRGENLGDALLRSVLNYCDLNSIKKVYYPYENLYLEKKGFKLVDKSEIELVKIKNIKIDKVMFCNTEEFFKDGCQTRRRC